jgi:hypothetical protein
MFQDIGEGPDGSVWVARGANGILEPIKFESRKGPNTSPVEIACHQVGTSKLDFVVAIIRRKSTDFATPRCTWRASLLS